MRLRDKLAKLDIVDWGFVIVLVGAALVRCYEITLPYIKPWESGFQEVIALNHLKYGFLETHFVSVLGKLNGENFYHLAHPPLFQILLALSYMVFGVHEWAARLVVILFSLGSIILFYIAVRKAWDNKIALIASIFMSLMPLSAYFGRVVQFYTAALFFAMLVFVGYVYWIDKARKRYYALMVLGVVLGGLIDWPFYLILPALLLHSIISKKKRISMLGLLGIGFVMVGVLFLYEYNLTGHITVLEHSVRRSDPTFLTSAIFYKTLIKRLIRYAPVCSLLSVFWLWRLSSGGSKSIGFKPSLVISLFAFGISYLILAPQAAYVHDSVLYYLVPALAIAPAIELNNLRKHIRISMLLLSIVVMFSLTIKIHSIKHGIFKDLYDAGKLVNRISIENDLMFSNLTGPIAYYAYPRVTTFFPLNLNPLEEVQRGDYKFLLIPTNRFKGESVYVNGQNTSAENLGYHKIFGTSQFCIWASPERTLKEYHFSTDLDQAEIKSYSINGNVVEVKQSGYVSLTTLSIGDEVKRVIFHHPVNKGELNLIYNGIKIPDNSLLTFSIGLNPKVYFPDKGDGVEFIIYIDDELGTHKVFSKYIDPKNNPSERKWHDAVVDLSPYYGQEVTVRFVTTPGPKNNTSYDWAFWGDPRIVVNKQTE